MSEVIGSDITGEIVSDHPNQGNYPEVMAGVIPVMGTVVQDPTASGETPLDRRYIYVPHSVCYAEVSMTSDVVIGVEYPLYNSVGDIIGFFVRVSSHYYAVEPLDEYGTRRRYLWTNIKYINGIRMFRRYYPVVMRYIYSSRLPVNLYRSVYERALGYGAPNYQGLGIMHGLPTVDELSVGSTESERLENQVLSDEEYNDTD